MMNNEITINPEEIKLLPDNSIADAETIRQIALYAIKFNDNSLNDKVDRRFSCAGLYPHIIAICDNLPEHLSSQHLAITLNKDDTNK